MEAVDSSKVVPVYPALLSHIREGHNASTIHSVKYVFSSAYLTILPAMQELAKAAMARESMCHII
jgi:hypothetical protein